MAVAIVLRVLNFFVKSESQKRPRVRIRSVHFATLTTEIVCFASGSSVRATRVLFFFNFVKLYLCFEWTSQTKQRVILLL